MADKLKACPFCGTAWEIATESEFHSIQHPPAECVLTGLQTPYTAQTVEWLNRRVGAADTARLREALEKIRDRDYRGNRCPCADLADRVLRAVGDDG